MNTINEGKNTMSETYVFHVNSHVNVPINERGRRAVTEEHEYVEFIDDDFSSMKYSDEDALVLTDLFMEFNDVFDLLIDDCEDELLPADKVTPAVAMTKAFLNRSKESDKPRIERFLAMLELAQRTNMPVSFNL